MEARQRVERCAARVRAEREDRLETRQTGAQPRDRTPIRSLQVSCTAIVLAGLGWKSVLVLGSALCSGPWRCQIGRGERLSMPSHRAAFADNVEADRQLSAKQFHRR